MSARRMVPGLAPVTARAYATAPARKAPARAAESAGFFDNFACRQEAAALPDGGIFNVRAVS